MSHDDYLIIAYVIGLGLLVGHAAVLWRALRAEAARARLLPSGGAAENHGSPSQPASPWRKAKGEQS